MINLFRIFLVVIFTVITTKAYAQTNDERLQNGLVGYIAAGELAEFILRQAAIDDENDSFFDNERLLAAIRILEAEQFDEIINFDTSSSLTLNQISTIESAIVNIRQQPELNQNQVISRIISEAEQIAGEFDVYNLAQDVYQFSIRFNEVVDTSSPLNARLDSAIDLSLNARNAMLHSIAVSNIILQTFPNTQIASAARFWVQNRASKGFVRVLGPQSAIISSVSAILIGAEIQAAIFTAIKANQDREIKGNLFEIGIANTTRRSVILQALVRFYLEREEAGAQISFRDITLIPEINNAADVTVPGLPPVSISALIRNFEGRSDLEALPNDEKIHLVLETLGTFADIEDAELGIATRNLLDDTDLFSNVLQTIRVRDANEFNIVSGDSLRNKFFPYDPSRRSSGADYYSTIFKIFFNGEVASYMHDRLATLGNAIAQVESDVVDLPCEITNTCNSLAMVTGVQASDGTFQDRIRVVWNPVAQATDYDVLRCDSASDTICTQIATTSQTSFDERALPATRNFFYRVRACNQQACSIRLSNVDSGFIQADVQSDSFLHISDSVIDGTSIAGGSTFTQRQRLRNNGATTWNSSYCLRPNSGINLGRVNQVCVVGSVAPGEDFIFEIPMQAPQATSADALVRNYWRLSAGATPFPNFIYTEILVPGEAPQANRPLGFSAQALNPTSVRLSWTADSSGSVYRIERTVDDGEFSLLSSLSSLEFLDNGRQPETRYRYRLQRCIDSNIQSCSSFSSVATVTTPAAADPSSLVSSINVSNSSPLRGSAIDISARLTNGGGISVGDQFQFFFALSQDNDLDVPGDVILFRAPESNTNFRLGAGENNDFEIRYSLADDATLGSVNVIGCALFRDINGQAQQQCQAQPIVVQEQPVAPPNTPDLASINYSQGNDFLSVAWNRSTDAPFFRLERSESAGGGFSEVLAGNALSFVDRNINSGTAYFYRLRACQNSLPTSCSPFSLLSTVITLSTATNDLSIPNIDVSVSGSEFNVEAEQLYTGTSRDIIRANIGFFLSTDEFCSAQNDFFIGSGATGFSTRDTMDNEDVSFRIPSSFNGQTVFACAIADYQNTVSEQNENNNARSIVIRTSVPAPRLRAMQPTPSGFATITVTWNRIPNVSRYILNRDFGGGNFTAINITTGTSFTDIRLEQCQQIRYRLDACNSNNVCSSSPVVSAFTLPARAPAPRAEVVSNNRVDVSWDDVDCAGFYILERAREGGDFRDYVHTSPVPRYQDIFSVLPGGTYRYRITYCSEESERFVRNGGCSRISDPVSVTVPQNVPQNNDWIERNISENVSGILFPSRIVFRNSLYHIGGRRGDESLNSVWRSKDGFDWEQVTSNAEFSPRRLPNLVVHNDVLYLIGGRLQDGSYNDEVWSTSDGVTWELLNGNAPFGERINPAVTSFNGKIILIGGKVSDFRSDSLADIWTSSDGITWVRETNAAPFGIRDQHSLLKLDENQLILFGGETIINGDVLDPQIWLSSNGVDWELARTNVPFGERDRMSPIEFDNRYWVIGGRKAVQFDASRNDDTQRFESRYTEPYTNDVWVSDNGLDWSEFALGTAMPIDEVANAVNFNNQIIVGRLSAGRLWSATYGALSGQPEGAALIQGATVIGSTVSADLSAIDFEFDASRLTYHWFENGEKINDANQSTLLLNDFDIGDEISLQVRYQSDSLALWEFTSGGVTLFANPIETTFESSQLNISSNQNDVENRLLNMDNNTVVNLVVDDPTTVTATTDNDRVLVSANAIGSTRVSVTVQDNITLASRDLEFNVEVSRISQPISFTADRIRVSLSDASVPLLLNDNSVLDSDLELELQSSAPSVATAVINGDRLEAVLAGVGLTTITVTQRGTDEFAESSATIEVEVFLDDFDRDGVADENDNCVSTVNPDQLNSDNDRFGDACDQDDDSDFVVDTNDCAPLDINNWQFLDSFADFDLDGVGDGSAMVICSGFMPPSPFVAIGGDNCVDTPNPDQVDSNRDGVGDACTTVIDRENESMCFPIMTRDDKAVLICL